MSELNLLQGVQLEDQTVVVEGGAKLDPIPAGPTRARLVVYAELGQKLAAKQFQNEAGDKTQNRFVVGLEVFGKNVPRGDKPRLAWFFGNISHGQKSNFPRTAARINYDGKTPHIAMAAAAKKPFILNVKLVDKGEKGIFNEFGAEGVLDVQPPVMYRPDEEGEMEAQPVKVPEAESATAIFLWDQPSADQWKSIEAYPFITKAIKEAHNYKGSKAQVIIEGAAEVAEEAKEPADSFDDFED